MKIGLWNIDHPMSGTGRRETEGRTEGILEYLSSADCDLYILTEANAAIALPGYQSAFSAESPFKSARRSYAHTNRYHQVGIYSKTRLDVLEVEEPINGLLCRTSFSRGELTVYGNVMTIKDQWAPSSSMRYADRLREQLAAIGGLSGTNTLVGGDFNLRLGWPQKLGAYNQLSAQVVQQGLLWPTKNRTDTVQHVLHTSDLAVSISVDLSVKHPAAEEKRLSDHPFVEIVVS